MAPSEWDRLPGTTDEALAQRITLALEQKRLSQAKLSAYLGFDHRSAITRMIRKPALFRQHATKIAAFLGTSTKVLLGQALLQESAEADATMAPRDDAPPIIAAESLLSRAIPGDEQRDGALPLPPGMLIRHLARSESNHLRSARVAVLCSPTKAVPVKGDVVIVETRDGSVWLRKYDRDFRDKSKLILGAFNPGDDPLVIEESELAEMRLVIGTVNLGVMP